MEFIGEKICCFLPVNSIESQAIDQLKNTAEMPFIFKHVAAMPDCHLGMGATVGSVIATKNAIMPAAVGVDIGCGMIAVKTKFYEKDLPNSLREIREGIERRVPVSAGGYNSKITKTAEQRIKKLGDDALISGNDPDHFDNKWSMQLGTLGSGNHFIEISLDENDQVWVVLHSGSRGIGNKLAQNHIKVAQKLMDDMHITLKDRDLAYLPENMSGFKEYISDLHWAQEFARMNRDEMMDRVMTQLSYSFFGEDGHQKEIELERINCHHNFTQMEHHFGQNVWITRKGAIQMQLGQLGVIPGSMGTRSYIVEGLANPMSFHSAPHGAGRRMSRNKAKEKFTMEDLEKAMQGIEFRHSEAFIDEIPGAYKDIDEVMENSKQLVSVKHVLRQVLNVKGN